MNLFLRRLILTAPKCSSFFSRRHAAHFTFFKDQPDPSYGLFVSLIFFFKIETFFQGPTKEMNLCQTIQNTLDITLGNDNTASKAFFFLFLLIYSKRLF